MRKRFEFRNLWVASIRDYSLQFIFLDIVYDKARNNYEDNFIEITILNFEFRWFL